MPKQYLPLAGQPIALYSLGVFAGMREVGELVVVCDASYDSLFRRTRLPAACLPAWLLSLVQLLVQHYRGCPRQQPAIGRCTV